MQYIVKTTVVIDSESDKDTFRDFIKNKMVSDMSAKKMVSWNMDVTVIAKTADTEHYASEAKE